MPNTQYQAESFLVMIVAGAAAGILYDLTALARRALCAGRCLSLLCDLLFGAFAALCAIAGLLLARRGEVRAYLLLGYIAGFLLYLGGPRALLRAPLYAAARALQAGTRRLASSPFFQNLVK